MRAWLVSLIIGGLVGIVGFLFGALVQGFNPRADARNAVGLGVLVGLAATGVVRGLLWLLARL